MAQTAAPNSTHCLPDLIRLDAYGRQGGRQTGDRNPAAVRGQLDEVLLDGELSH